MFSLELGTCAHMGFFNLKKKKKSIGEGEMNKWGTEDS